MTDPRGRDDEDDEAMRETLAEELLGDDPEPEDGWLDFDEDGNLLPRQPHAPPPPPDKP